MEGAWSGVFPILEKFSKMIYNSKDDPSDEKPSRIKGPLRESLLFCQWWTRGESNPGRLG